MLPFVNELSDFSCRLTRGLSFVAHVLAGSGAGADLQKAAQHPRAQISDQGGHVVHPLLQRLVLGACDGVSLVAEIHPGVGDSDLLARVFSECHRASSRLHGKLQEVVFGFSSHD